MPFDCSIVLLAVKGQVTDELSIGWRLVNR